MIRFWHSAQIEAVFDELKTSESGLSIAEAAERLKKNGPNTLPEAKPDSIGIIFLRQFRSPLIYILIVASAVIFAIGEVVDGSIIAVVLLFNAFVGTIQEGRAQNTLRALKKFVETTATVVRDGKEIIIPDKELVPGDFLILGEGEKVPADARITLSRGLKIDEASLTGESEPVAKTIEPISRTNIPASEQRNMLFMGTNIAAGGGRAVVVTTGKDTVIGKIAKEISSIDTEIPLKANIRYLSHLIIGVVAVVSVLIFGLGLLYEKSLVEIFTTVVALAVSVIPEGLPIVITLVLATGVWRMGKRNALIKKLQAVEALGQARVIAVDKTGTITKNELVVREVWTEGKVFKVGGLGYEPVGAIELEDVVVESARHPELLFAGKIAALSANARTSFLEGEGRWRVSGDPTEAALLVFGEKTGFKKSEALLELPILDEIPFDYRYKYHATLHSANKKNLLVVEGAPERVLTLSTHIRKNGKKQVLSEREREELWEILLKMSERGLRVVAGAVRTEAPERASPEEVRGLTFVGFYGMQDVLRPEVKEAMARATEAGIRVVMITGDHKLTARAIAKEAGVWREGEGILTGEEIDALSDTALAAELHKVTVFARVTPEHKLRIVTAYKKRGVIVAMTGDGVNDAPSLVAADLGVSMGKIGTEVAKEASDIVLLDDNFGSIVSAVEEGRGIYKTIKKVLLYLFAGSWSQVLTIVGALSLALPLPLLPAQIIWLNFVTDGFLDVSLAMEPKEKGLLKGNFERPKKYLIDTFMLTRLFFMVVPMTLGALFVFSLYAENDITKAWTMTLTVLAAFHWFNAWNCRHETESIFTLNPFSNKFLVGATVLIIILHLLALYTPLLQSILRTTPLSFTEWLIIVPTALSVVAVEEVRKFFARRRETKNAITVA